jgi:hypothetical protein
MAHNPRTAVLYVSHLVTPETLWNYFRIRRGVPAEYDLYWVYQGNYVPYGLSVLPIETFQVSDEMLEPWRPAMKGNLLIPGNLHVLLLTFSQRHPYDYYWFIEYDVHFADDWSRLFRLSQGSETDLITGLVESPFEDAFWSHWDTIDLPYRRLLVPSIPSTGQAIGS